MSIKAGFGKVEITPRVGVELCGYGAYLNRHSTCVLEPLYARALAVECNGERWVVVSCDLIALSAPLAQRVRALVCRQTGLREQQVMVHATHTHSGPCTILELIGWGDVDDPYVEMLPRFVARACVEAVQDLREATFHHAEVPAVGFSYNRELPDPGRTNDLVLAGQWITDKPQETDTTAHVFRVDRGGKVAGFLTYFSCHPVVAGSQNREIHGDFVGIATNRVERDHPGAVGLFLQGCQGDINSSYVHGAADQTLQALEQFGSRFADVIRSGLAAAQPVAVDRVAWAESDEPYTLSDYDDDRLQRLLAPHEEALAAAPIHQPDGRANMAMVYVKAIRQIRARRQRGEPDRRPFLVQSFRLGPVSFTATPFEVMHRIKRRFQGEMGNGALLLSVTNGFLGYAPLREYYQTPPERYAAYVVPFMLGTVPYTPHIEDEVLRAALRVARHV